MLIGKSGGGEFDLADLPVIALVASSSCVIRGPHASTNVSSANCIARSRERLVCEGGERPMEHAFSTRHNNSSNNDKADTLPELLLLLLLLLLLKDPEDRSAINALSASSKRRLSSVDQLIASARREAAIAAGEGSAAADEEDCESGAGSDDHAQQLASMLGGNGEKSGGEGSASAAIQAGDVSSALISLQSCAPHESRSPSCDVQKKRICSKRRTRWRFGERSSPMELLETLSDASRLTSASTAKADGSSFAVRSLVTGLLTARAGAAAEAAAAAAAAAAADEGLDAKLSYLLWVELQKRSSCRSGVSTEENGAWLECACTSASSVCLVFSHSRLSVCDSLATSGGEHESEPFCSSGSCFMARDLRGGRCWRGAAAGAMMDWRCCSCVNRCSNEARLADWRKLCSRARKGGLTQRGADTATGSQKEEGGGAGSINDCSDGTGAGEAEMTTGAATIEGAARTGAAARAVPGFGVEVKPGWEP